MNQQINLLYHFTTILSLLKIVDTDILGEDISGYESVSFTRYKHFYKETKIIPAEAVLIIDRDKLKTKYKIKPVRYQGFTKKEPHELEGVGIGIENQYEEEVLGRIHNISKYVVKIIISELELDSMLGEEELLVSIGNIIEKEPDYIVPSIDILKFIESKGFKVEIKNVFFARQGMRIKSEKKYWEIEGFEKCLNCGSYDER